MSVRKTLVFLFVKLVLWPYICFAQDDIMLLSGKQINDVKIVEIGAEKITFLPQNNLKQKKVYRDRVFSIAHVDGTEKVIYLPNLIDEEMSISDMRFFIKGTNDARRLYKNTGSYFLGFVFGVAGPFVGGITYPIITPFPPATGIFLSSLSCPDPEKQPIDKKYLTNEPYQMGYEKKARAIKTRNALYGALAGIAVGMVSLKIIDK